jgi:hypothetical protein
MTTTITYEQFCTLKYALDVETKLPFDVWQCVYDRLLRGQYEHYLAKVEDIHSDTSSTP